MTYRTRLRPTPDLAPNGVQAGYDDTHHLLEALNKRLIRMETRLSALMQHEGMTSDGAHAFVKLGERK